MTTIDTLIKNAEDLKIEIEYISMGPKTMQLFAEELSGIADNYMEGVQISVVAKYKEIPIRLTEINGLTVKYVTHETFWGELN